MRLSDLRPKRDLTLFLCSFRKIANLKVCLAFFPLALFLVNRNNRYSIRRTYRCKRVLLCEFAPCEENKRIKSLKINGWVTLGFSILVTHHLDHTGARNENIVQNHLNIAMLNVF